MAMRWSSDGERWEWGTTGVEVCFKWLWTMQLLGFYFKEPTHRSHPKFGTRDHVRKKEEEEAGDHA
eukprot:CAMPEP_0179452416 /NCGR_PEP_ID=MMETSP0799-20121207/36276_1 /TAXON_ID=46947 /ORGANISM="Geminigera cryophila, Strain CCMP2564" /LENGTH=65 /DNA_ID=CAMNT_0021248265 /DNA_START=752 /DNA_END=946 /DNA_ORIENTATION=-